MTLTCTAPAWLAGLSLLSALVGCGGAAQPGGDRAASGSGGAAPFVLETLEWAGAGELEWRAVTSTRSARWLVRARGADPREVDVLTGTASTASRDAWDRAAGPVVRADERRAQSSAIAGSHVRDGRLSLGGVEVSTRHATVLDAAVSPDGRAIAVLSADGVKRSPAPALGGGANATGQHAVEVFDLASARRTALVALPITTESLALAGHWSGDPSLLIYSDALLTRLCFVRLP